MHLAKFGRVLSVLFLASLFTLAGPSIPAAQAQTLKACAKIQNGQLRLVASAADCLPSETFVELGGPVVPPPPPSTQDVVVINGPDAPVPVVVQNQPAAGEPFQRFLTAQMIAGDFNTGDDLSVLVPAGKRLVIETVSAIVITAAGQNVRIRVDATAGGAAAHHLTIAQEAWQGQVDHKAIGALRLYADQATTVFIRVSRDQGAGAATVNASISGHLIDAP